MLRRIKPQRPFDANVTNSDGSDTPSSATTSPRTSISAQWRAPTLGSGRSLPQAMHKAPMPQHVAQLLRHRLGRHAPRVRAMATANGTYYVSSTVVHGIAGKFRVARHSDGTLFGIKEFRLPDNAKFNEGQPKKKTVVTRRLDVLAEQQLTRRLAPRATLYGNIGWHGNLYTLMTPFRGDLGDMLSELNYESDVAPRLLSLRNVARDLAFIHKSGFVHRDVKWNNVLLDELGQPMLWDFGMARALRDQPIVSVSHLAGTYFPPEAIERDGSGRYSWQPASDVFCLGTMVCDLFENLGPNPFDVEWKRDRRGQLTSPTMGGRRDGFALYGAWHEAVMAGVEDQEHGFDTLMANIFAAENGYGQVGHYFAGMLRRDPFLTLLSVIGMLSPDPDKRFAAEDLSLFLTSYLERWGDEEKAADVLRAIPRAPDMQLAIDAVTLVQQSYHPNTVLTTAA